MSFLSFLFRGRPYVHEASGIVFPRAVGSLSFAKASAYQPTAEESGTAIEYSGHQCKVTVFIRDQRDPMLTAEVYLAVTMQGIKDLESAGLFRDVRVFAQRAEQGRRGWQSAAFTASVKDGFVASFVFCTVHQEHPIKVRASTLGKNIPALLDNVGALLAVIDGEAMRSAERQLR